MFIERPNDVDFMNLWTNRHPELSFFLLECEHCDLNDAYVYYDANIEMPTIITCPECGTEINLFVCMNDGCTNLLPGHHALVVRFGNIIDGYGIDDTDFSFFDGPQYACSTKCLVEAMTHPDMNEFVPEKDYGPLVMPQENTLPPINPEMTRLLLKAFDDWEAKQNP